ncbi:hypothetical protein K435DRAFT_804500 [Dendrothele bispora CBS 962.96]|uniref:Uncharacterized protein n=1 Tax=Dendrothele bispora (strain CBS 962.96) TaxID=1314807 RepID=A0A4S8LE70_DENBC|nr:hypothetical protein K435DRAFT_804500 [Dendrothele bispora CBS 962.96]
MNQHTLKKRNRFSKRASRLAKFKKTAAGRAFHLVLADKGIERIYTLKRQTKAHYRHVITQVGFEPAVASSCPDDNLAVALESDGAGDKRVSCCKAEERISEEFIGWAGEKAAYLWPLLRRNGWDIKRGGTTMVVVKRREERPNLGVNATPVESLLPGESPAQILNGFQKDILE